MTITARYPGKCSECGGSIHAGDQIEWAKGEGSKHEACDRAAARAERKAAHRRARNAMMNDYLRRQRQANQ